MVCGVLLQVIVQDNGIPPKYATASVAITIQDVNDNDPTFNPKNYEAIVSESDLPGTPVVNVVATDPDENPRFVESSYSKRNKMNGTT